MPCHYKVWKGELIINTRSKYTLLFAIFMACLLFIIFQFFLKQEKPRHNTAINRGIIQSESFIVNSVSSGLNTFAKGTVFVSGDKGRVNHVQIVAMIEIDPNDWGGVAFDIPNGISPTS